jgi:hypothetical protein
MEPRRGFPNFLMVANGSDEVRTVNENGVPTLAVAVSALAKRGGRGTLECQRMAPYSAGAVGDPQWSMNSAAKESSMPRESSLMA